MSAAEEGSLFYDYPPELLAKIFHFLDPESKTCIRLTCRRWWQVLDTLATDGLDFEGIIRSNDDLKYILNTNRELKQVKFDNWDLPYLCMDLSSGDSSVTNKFPVIRSLSIGANNLWSNICLVLNDCSESLTSLSISEASLIHCNQNCQLLENINLVNLSELEVFDLFQIDCWSLGEFLGAANFEKLEKFTVLGATGAIEIWPEQPSIEVFFMEFYDFIARHSQTLKSLMVNLNVKYPKKSYSLPTQVLTEKLQEEIDNLKLEVLDLTFKPSQQEILVPFLTNCETLRELSWSVAIEKGAPTGLTYLLLNDLLVQNETTLESLKVDNSVFILDYLRSCKSLRHLSLNGQCTWDGLLRCDIPSVTSLELLEISSSLAKYQDVISRRFVNLEKLKFMPMGKWDIEMDLPAIEELLTMPKIKQISYGHINCYESLMERSVMKFRKLCKKDGYKYKFEDNFSVITVKKSKEKQ